MALSVAIIGPGALGTSIGRVLERGGARVSYVGRGGRVVAGAPLVVDPQEEGGHNDGLAWPEEVIDEKLVVVTAKSFDTRAIAVENGRSRLFVESHLVTLQNGLGNIEWLARGADPYKLFAGATTHAARRDPDGSVETVDLGETVIASMPSWEPAEHSSERASFFAEALTHHGLPARAEVDAARLLWRKLVVSCGINALTALERCTNGALLERPAALARAVAAAEETRAVGLAKGVDLASIDPKATVVAVCERTAANRSSMLQDIEAGRRTEVREINGAVVAEAAKTHLKDAPVNRALLEEILTLEARSPRERTPQENLTRHGR